MKNLAIAAKAYIMATILIGLGLMGWAVVRVDWANPWLYVVAALGAVAQTLKLDGPNARTNYSVAWFVYGFAFVMLGPAAVMFVIVAAHLVEWIWHKYPWYIQCFNIGNHLIALFVAGIAFRAVDEGANLIDVRGAAALAVADLIFVMGNHFLVGLVVKLARGQSFSESGVFGFLTVFLDFSVLSMGAITALVWRSNPLASVLNVLPLYILYNALRVPALERQVQDMRQGRRPLGAPAAGD